MTDFVGATPFLRITLWIAMETVYFHIAHIFVFDDTMFRKFGVPIKIWYQCEIVLRGASYVKLDSGIIVTFIFLAHGHDKNQLIENCFVDLNLISKVTAGSKCFIYATKC